MTLAVRYCVSRPRFRICGFLADLSTCVFADSNSKRLLQGTCGRRQTEIYKHSTRLIFDVQLGSCSLVTWTARWHIWTNEDSVIRYSDAATRCWVKTQMSSPATHVASLLLLLQVPLLLLLLLLSFGHWDTVGCRVMTGRLKMQDLGNDESNRTAGKCNDARKQYWDLVRHFPCLAFHFPALRFGPFSVPAWPLKCCLCGPQGICPPPFKSSMILVPHCSLSEIPTCAVRWAM